MRRDWSRRRCLITQGGASNTAVAKLVGILNGPGTEQDIRQRVEIKQTGATIGNTVRVTETARLRLNFGSGGAVGAKQDFNQVVCANQQAAGSGSNTATINQKGDSLHPGHEPRQRQRPPEHRGVGVDVSPDWARRSICGLLGNRSRPDAVPGPRRGLRRSEGKREHLRPRAAGLRERAKPDQPGSARSGEHGRRPRRQGRPEAGLVRRRRRLHPGSAEHEPVDDRGYPAIGATGVGFEGNRADQHHGGRRPSLLRSRSSARQLGEHVAAAPEPATAHPRQQGARQPRDVRG